MLEKRIEDLQRMALQVNRIDGAIVRLTERWQRHVYDQGFQMLNDEALAKKTFRAIEDFIEFKKQCDDLVIRVFQRKDMQEIFMKCVRTAFEKFLNIDPNIIAEYLAKFLDFYLKKNTGSSNMTMNDEKLDKLVTDTIEIFKFVNAKDVFEEFYLRGLARRLLLKKSASTEAEKIMLTKIRTECSSEFGTKTDSMLKDLLESEHIMKEYRTVKGGEDCLRDKNEGIEASFHILS